MMHFLTRSIDRLGPDGALRPTGVREPALGEPTILLARSLCRFSLFKAPAGLGPGAAVAAARLHADTHAPYDLFGVRLARRGDLFGLWWWDDEAVRSQLAAVGAPGAVRLVPEAFAQPDGAGWRVLKGDDGYEAQTWLDGFLVGSNWRRRPFDAEGWTAFARVQPAEAATPPETPPPAYPAPFTARSAYRRRLLTRSGQDLAPPLPAAAALLALFAAACLFAGQGLALKSDRHALAAQLEFLRNRPRNTLLPRMRVEAQQLQTLQRVYVRPDPITLVADAQRILRPFGLKVSSFEASADAVTAAVQGEAAAGVDLVSEELEASPTFRDVSPRLDRERHQLVLTMRAESAGSALPGNGADKVAGVVGGLQLNAPPPPPQLN